MQSYGSFSFQRLQEDSVRQKDFNGRSFHKLGCPSVLPLRVLMRWPNIHEGVIAALSQLLIDVRIVDLSAVAPAAGEFSVQGSSSSHDRRVRARIGFAGLLSCIDTTYRYRQSNCKDEAGDRAKIHSGPPSHSASDRLFDCGAFHREAPQADAVRCRETPHPAPFSRYLRSRCRGGQRMLEAGVAVVDGNLEEPRAGQRTGRRRSLVLLNPGCRA